MVSGTGTWTTKLLWFASSWISNKKGSVVGNQSLLKFILALFINVLLVVSNKALSNSLTDSINLRYVTTTRNLYSDVNIGELVESNNKERLVDLESENFGLNKGNWRTINLDETLTSLNSGNSSSSLLLTKGLK